MYTMCKVGVGGPNAGEGRVGSGDLLREGVPVHYGPGHKWVLVTVHR